MAAISTWSTTAASNNSAPPDGAPEGMAPSGVNNVMRENMAQVRDFYNTLEWRDWGHTITYASGTTFTTGASLDTTGIYVADRRVRAVGSSTGTIYGTVSSSTGTNPTTVTVVWDSGALVSEALVVSLGLSPTGSTYVGIPSGVILLWSGSTGSIPSGWVICDGTNSTPDLRDRFVIGAGSTYAVDATGGSADAIAVAHTHTGTTDAGGTHSHTYTHLNTNQTGAGGGSSSFITNGTGTTSTAPNHTHAFTTASSGSSGTNANLPPYYSLAYIMKS